MTRAPALYAAGLQVVRLLGVLLFRIRMWGARNVPARGRVILASNHQSFLDPPLVGAGARRTLHFVARRSLFAPGLGPFIRALNAVPVGRGQADLGAFHAALGILGGEGALLLFPEGTRTPDGAVKAFKPGFALMAGRAAAPIVPAAIHGGFRLWPRGQALPRLGPVHVAYGEPMDPPRGDKEACRAAAREAQRRVAELLAMLKTKD